ncbi:MAG: alcohol dehydrogenase catalytic domain-containing protein [Candidatus Lokiarchaeota archaeon]
MNKLNNPDHISALVFERKVLKLAIAYLRGMTNPNGYWKKGGPIVLKQVPFPSLISEDWLIVKVIYCGICGSDIKEITLSGALDNPLQTFITFPQIMGHEVVGIVYDVGSNAKYFKKGDRIAVSPWFPCESRGIKPVCNRCLRGDFVHCKNFQKGYLPVGMHLGVTRGFGGYSSYITVHESQCFLIPDNVTFEQAVLADPFSVAFHAILNLSPKKDSIILVYGLGVIGLLTILCLKSLFGVKHILAVGKYEFQKEIALDYGANHVFMKRDEELIEDISNYLGIDLYTPEKGLKWSLDGVDGIIDTIASSKTIEIGIRILKSQKRLVFLGVSTPKRFENTPHYFKELEVMGSNAFGLEYFHESKHHSFEFFLDFLSEKKIDISSIVTHKFPLERYADAFYTITNKKETKAIKVVFTFS